MTTRPLFDAYERTDSTPPRSFRSPSGHVCPECECWLEADWSPISPHADWCTLGALWRRAQERASERETAFRRDLKWMGAVQLVVLAFGGWVALQLVPWWAALPAALAVSCAINLVVYVVLAGGRR